MEWDGANTNAAGNLQSTNEKRFAAAIIKSNVKYSGVIRQKIKVKMQRQAQVNRMNSWFAAALIGYWIRKSHVGVKGTNSTGNDVNDGA